MFDSCLICVKKYFSTNLKRNPTQQLLTDSQMKYEATFFLGHEIRNKANDNQRQIIAKLVQEPKKGRVGPII